MAKASPIGDSGILWSPFSVLDTQSGASGGTYVSKLNDTDLAITRVTGRGDGLIARR